MSAVTRSVAGFPMGVFPQLQDWIVVAGRSERAMTIRNVIA
jgi:hypothetical protein